MTFIDALAFNWLVAGTDGHAKNYSMLIGPGGKNRLAPLYDLASALPYDGLNQHKLKLAMKIGGEYRLRNISIRHWKKLAQEVRLDDEIILNRVQNMAARLTDDASSVGATIQKEGLRHPILDKLVDRIAKRTVEYRKALNRL